MVELKPVTIGNTLNRRSHVDMNYNQAIHFVFQHVDILPSAEESVPGMAVFHNDSLWVYTTQGWKDVLVGKVPVEPDAQMMVATFSEPSTEWVIEHDLNQLALVECISSEGQLINGDVVWDIGSGNARSMSGKNRITVSFSEALSGFAVFVSDKNPYYETVYEFSNAAKKWVINHGLGHLVAVQCIDSNGQKIRGTTHWNLEDKNSVTVNFSRGQSGWAVIAGGDPEIPSRVYDFANQDEWVIQHGLGRYVEVQTMDANGKAIKGDIVWSKDMNSVSVTFSQPLSGKALIV